MDHSKTIDANFEDTGVRAGIKMLCDVLATFDEHKSGKRVELRDCLAVAVFGAYNQPFMSAYMPVMRVPFMEALRALDRSSVDVFLGMAIPLVKSTLNGASSSSYFQAHSIVH